MATRNPEETGIPVVRVDLVMARSEDTAPTAATIRIGIGHPSATRADDPDLRMIAITEAATVVIMAPAGAEINTWKMTTTGPGREEVRVTEVYPPGAMILMIIEKEGGDGIIEVLSKAHR